MEANTAEGRTPAHRPTDKTASGGGLLDYRPVAPMDVIAPADGASWVEPPRVVSAEVRARASLLRGRSFSGPERRARDQRAGRACAAQALRDAGATDVTVGVGPDRAPRWPSGFAGSITHTETGEGTFACAVAVRRDCLRSIGIDSERVLDEDAMREVVPMFLDHAEMRVLHSGLSREIATVAFSAKESLFKCLFPCAGVFFEFTDAELEWLRESDANVGSFGLRLRISLGLEFPRGLRIEGRYAIEGALVHTAVELAP
jgi:enterobactin synthetase component D